MKKEIEFQLKNAVSSTGFLGIYFFMIIYSIACFVVKCIIAYKADIMTLEAAYSQFFLNGMYGEYTGIFTIIFPFAVSAAYADSYVSDYKNNSLAIFLTRMSVKKYYFSKMIAVFLCGGFVIFFPQILNFLLCIITFPLESTNLYTWDLWQAEIYIYMGEVNYLFKSLYIISPYLYFLFYILFSSIVAGVISVISYQLSYFVKNKMFVLSFMFIIINLAGHLLGTYGIQLDIKNCIIGNYAGMPTYFYFAVTIAIYFLLAVLPTPFAIKKLRECI